MSALWSHLGISPTGVLSVMISSAVLYLILTTVLRLWGQALLAGVSTFSLVLTTLLGAVAARAALGDYPTLGGGLVALATLLVMERLLGRVEALRNAAHGEGARSAGRPAVLLMIGDQVRGAELRRHRISEPQLWAALREHGITRRSQVRLVVLESRGRISVLGAGEPIDPVLLDGVAGVHEVPAAWFETDVELSDPAERRTTRFWNRRHRP